MIALIFSSVLGQVLILTNKDKTILFLSNTIWDKTHGLNVAKNHKN
ncbi:hypothetical protein LEP1GSC103_2446 [Leptospira borgpetersenii serovar Javanica str. UI 09931]|uniref:Uncharacterized protein n=3 Tax=Leptospira borgpetersenii TaxID=174 RepID=M3GT92_LEPBO|nr:hypothetical protein LEP1GSC128_3703 [Leptospira borgpetersenii str. 200801926]EKQ91134.1 hypothetical protein LEP1GSC101_0844 [Leptospira borgpetersenii str. UI 09149]EMF98023.1 hypothetical protein LEP1GSC123_2022 [Leptospira borgpetersenii str. 200701203]EMN59378.1 hypothetical protein LEP1GSC090_1815 [Leptospira borgpetersenii serovar Javanica str. MK146]ENO65156.1 hypothetical protein LEP1GSC191_2431 [Leptospira borgpetersenii serovar Mini str. 201000851]EPG57776.1 hypothetical protein